MSWLLVRIYLCIALSNSIFAMPHQIYNPISRKKSIPNIGHNSEFFDDSQQSAEIARLSREKLKHTKKDAEKRSLTAGDSFTPNDMLPITEKLFNKVIDPGNGRGFVSSTHSPQELADKLFEAFFSTTKRIIFLKDEDLPGIDALQALALSGETVDLQVVSVTEATKSKNLRSMLERMKPKRSKYKLVSKIVTESKQDSTRKAERRSIKLSKYLNKKRRLVINKRRNNRLKQLKNKARATKASEAMVSSVVKKGRDVNKNQSCFWKYDCSNIVDLDTCRIHSECTNASNKSLDEIVIKHNSDEYTPAIDRFRKMLRIFSVDEEVEKILESRTLQSRPTNAAALKRVESLAEYFNKIIVDEQLSTTKFLRS